MTQGAYMRRIRTILFMAVLGILFLMPIPTHAAETEVVFLLDTSNSMNSQDKDRLAIDGIRQMIYSLPSDCRAGLVAYNTAIQSVVGLDAGMDELEAKLDAVQYSGYTNAGDGLTQAIGLFSQKEGVNRFVVMVSDGEIIMDSDQATQASRTLFNDAAAQAKARGIKVYIEAIGKELSNPQLHIFNAAEITDGAIYWAGPEKPLSEIANQLLFDRFGILHRSAGAADGDNGNLHVELPGAGNRDNI